MIFRQSRKRRGDVGAMSGGRLSIRLLSSRWRLILIVVIWHLDVSTLGDRRCSRVCVRLLRQWRARLRLVPILMMWRLGTKVLLGRAVLGLLRRASERRLLWRWKSRTGVIAWRICVWVAHGPACRLSSSFRVCGWIVLTRIWSWWYARIVLRIVLRYLALWRLRRLSVVLRVVRLRLLVLASIRRCERGRSRRG